MQEKSIFPKGAIKDVSGSCIVLTGDDIDTDRIIPARFLKCVSFEDLGSQVFADDRIALKGKHPFDKKENQNCKILIVNDNFGCGSSREHAPQALMRWGIRAIIGQSFAEIFFGNCLALGIPCATASEKIIKQLQERVIYEISKEWNLDLSTKKIMSSTYSFPIKIESGPLRLLLNGQWDATSQLISQKGKIKEKMKSLPYLNNFEKI